MAHALVLFVYSGTAKGSLQFFPMSVLHREPITPAPCSPLDPRWQLVQRVAASQFFAKGPKLRAFLLYVCENSLLGRPENLTAQLIGARVFGREHDYIPSEDNIVRVEARELRKRLAAYFAAEGRDEPVILEIPKGSYSPVFLPREAALPESPLPSVNAEPGTRSSSYLRGRQWAIPSLASALAISLGIIIWQAVGSPFRKAQAVFLAGLHQPASPPSDFSIYRDLLGPLGANSRRDALLVLSNPRIMTYFVSDSSSDRANDHAISIPVPKDVKTALAPALNERDRSFPYLFLHVTREDYTGIGEAVAAFHIGRLMDLLGRRVHLTQGRFLNWDHVDKQDLILLGGPRSNDWSYEKDAQSNFGIASDSIVNAKPLPGEQSVYRGDLSTDYALIQKLTTPYNFETLLLAGLSSAGTAAAGEFAANPEKMNAVYESIRKAASGGRFPPNWEILLKVAVRDGLPLDSSVVSIRPVPRSSHK